MSDRFDANAYWEESLSPNEQRCIGVAAVLFIASFHAEHAGGLSDVALGRWLHARRTALRALRVISSNVQQLSEGPDLATVDIRACRECGCTDESACEEGCHWVGPELCSRCGPAAAANNDPFEFDCAECGRHIVQYIPIPLSGDRCAECLHMPGWFRDTELRRIFDPGWVPPDG